MQRNSETRFLQERLGPNPSFLVTAICMQSTLRRATEMQECEKTGDDWWCGPRGMHATSKRRSRGKTGSKMFRKTQEVAAVKNDKSLGAMANDYKS